MNQKRLNIAVYLLGGLMVSLSVALGGILYWNYMFHMPYRIEADCCGRGIEAETMKRWSEREKEGFLDILNMAGWRVEEEQIASSVSTGRKQRTQVIAVYGSMELVEVCDILSGRYGLDVGSNYCVLSKDLSNHLFGSTEVAGECIKLGNERYIVAGVIEKEGDSLMIPMEEGEIEGVAVSFGCRAGAEEKMERLMSY